MKPTKTNGYLVRIEAFIPAELSDTVALAHLQKACDEVKKLIPNAAATITTTRR